MEFVPAGETLSPWNGDWAAQDEDGQLLYESQALWSVRMADQKDAAKFLVVYVDAMTGDVLGAGAESE